MCDVKYCKQKDIAVIYYGRKVCAKHWHKDCDERDVFDLKEHFGIKD